MSILLDGDNGETLPGNLTFTGTGGRIRADFSNTTFANRLMFQSSTTDGTTVVTAIPNGSSTIAQFQANSSSSDPGNASTFGLVVIAGSEGRLSSATTGTGTYLPMTFYTNNLERMRIESDAAARIKTTASVYNPRTAANTGAIDLSLGNNFTVSPTGPVTLTPSNLTEGQTGIIMLLNTSGYAISKASTITSDANFLSTVSAAGTYILFYFSGSLGIRLTYSQNVSY